MAVCRCPFPFLNASTMAVGLLALAVGPLALAGESRQEAATAKAATGHARELAVDPARVELVGRDSRQQLLVSARWSSETHRDVTRSASYVVADPRVARVAADGVVTPLASGETEVFVTAAGQRSSVRVLVRNGADYLPLDFRRDILPILTKGGCNGGGCHGKSDGRGGFKLSLFGYDSDADYDSIVKTARGRRLSPSSPAASLLLLKPTAVLPHGGGQRLNGWDPESARLVRWIAVGAPRGSTGTAELVRLEVRPEAPVLSHNQQQQLAVTAIYADASRRDVTRLTNFRSNDTSIATVDEHGLVTSGDRTGQTAIVCLYAGRSGVSRVVMPLENPKVAWPPLAENNFIDRHVAAKLRELHVAPSSIVDDGSFLRRATLQLAGRLPSVDELRSFLAESDSGKRGRAVDRLLVSNEHADYFAQHWADVLRNKRRGQHERLQGTIGFYAWIRHAIADNLPYDQFVRCIITARGDPAANPPAQWYAEVRYLDRYVDDTAQVFLGVRIGCARCHNHPFEKFTQDDYYGLAAFFARVGRKGGTKTSIVERRANELIYVLGRGDVKHPVTGEIVPPHGLDAAPLAIAPYDDPRRHLVDWMCRADNRYFARAFVNRMWAHFFGRGLVEPLDDQRATNPASNEPLLAALAGEFVRSGYDMRHILRLICTSTTYQLSSVANEDNLEVEHCYARFFPQRMTAEVMLDAIDTITESPTQYAPLPQGTRAVQLPDENFSNTFLTLFGRPPRESACECERLAEPSLSQVLFMMNDSFVARKLTSPGSRPERFASRDSRSEPDKIEELFLAALARRPTTDEMSTAREHVRQARDRLTGYRDLVWAILNTKEFLYIH